MNNIRTWCTRHFTDPQILSMVLLLFICLGVVAAMGQTLVPLLTGFLIAYVLEGAVGRLERLKLPRLASVLLVFFVFLALLLLLLFKLLPTLSAQVGQFILDLPHMFARGKGLLLQIPAHYPDFVSEKQMGEIIDMLQSEVGSMGQTFFSFSVASARRVVTFIIYLVLVPFLVFFFLKDKEKIFGWVSGFLPGNRGMSGRVWREVNQQFGNYLRGKFWQAMIVWAATFIIFSLMGLKTAMLLGLFVGLSVLVPYIGAAAAIIPVVLMGLSQWGAGKELVYLLVAYGMITLVDGYVVVPLLFSEAVDLHPVAIVVAILVFGSFWGFWGVLFAIPLATLVQAVIRAWAHRSRELEEEA